MPYDTYIYTGRNKVYVDNLIGIAVSYSFSCRFSLFKNTGSQTTRYESIFMFYILRKEYIMFRMEKFDNQKIVILADS